MGKKEKEIVEREKAWRGDRAEKWREEGLERGKRREKPWKWEQKGEREKRAIWGFYVNEEDEVRGILF